MSGGELELNAVAEGLRGVGAHDATSDSCGGGGKVSVRNAVAGGGRLDSPAPGRAAACGGDGSMARFEGDRVCDTDRVDGI